MAPRAKGKKARRTKVKKCSFRNCCNNSKNNPLITFFNFRKSNYQDWIVACENDRLRDISEINLLTHNYVCQEHFSKFDYTRVLSRYQPKLRDGVIPGLQKSEDVKGGAVFVSSTAAPMEDDPFEQVFVKEEPHEDRLDEPVIKQEPVFWNEDESTENGSIIAGADASSSESSSSFAESVTVKEEDPDNLMSSTSNFDVYNTDKPFACNYCNYRTDRKDSYRVHLITHKYSEPNDQVLKEKKECLLIDPDNMTNPNDNMSNPDDNTTNPHDMTNPDDNTTNPNDNMTNPNDNMTNPHDNMTNPNDCTTEKRYACHHCKYATNHKGTYGRHLLTHEPVQSKPYACPHCDYRANCKFNLNLHTLRHESGREKRFACSFCDYKTDRKDSLKGHLFKHNGNKPFSCSQCEYKTDRKGSYRRHLITHDSVKDEIFLDKPFACNRCTFKTGYKSSYTKHIALHDYVTVDKDEHNDL